MSLLNLIWQKFSPREKKFFLISVSLIIFACIVLVFIFIQENSVLENIGGGIYKEGVIGQPININPILSNNPTDQKISSLVFAPLSSLLKNLIVSNDGKVYTLELDDKLKWSDGEPLNSDDIIFTLQTIQDTNAHSPLYSSWQGVSWERISAIQVKIYLPNTNFLFQKNIENLQIIPKHILGVIPVENMALSEYKLEPVGSGPYKFLNFSKRKDGFITSYTLIKNNYSNQNPLIKKIEFVFFENEKDVNQALLTHQINGFGFFNQSAEINPNLLKGYNLQKIYTTTYYAALFNMTNPILKNINIRKALVLSANLPEINKKVLDNNGLLISGPVLNLQNTTSSTFNLPLAQSLISQWKAKNKNLSLNLNLVVPNVDFLKKIAEELKNNWETAGIDNVNILPFNFNSTEENSILKTKNYDVLILGNTPLNSDDLFVFWHSSQINYPGLNLSSYTNTQADNLLEKIRQTEDSNTRNQLLANFQNILANDYPAVFLFRLPYFYIYSKNLDATFPSSIITPQDIYQNINNWSIVTVRVLKFK